MYNLFLKLFSIVVTSFFSLQFQDVDGNNISMNSFPGKKILLVNIATGDSSKVGQLAGLQQLQQRFADSLVIIAFPSNSFGKESRSNAEIKAFCQNNYRTSFIIAAKDAVIGTAIQPVFNWLAHSEQNGDMDVAAFNNFQKFLIDKQGHIAGVLSPKIQPQDSLMITTITAQY